MKKIIEQDMCARCMHLEPTKPLPSSGQWEIECECAKYWPFTKISASANAISECPKFTAKESA